MSSHWEPGLSFLLAPETKCSQFQYSDTLASITRAARGWAPCGHQRGKHMEETGGGQILWSATLGHSDLSFS